MREAKKRSSLPGTDGAVTAKIPGDLVADSLTHTLQLRAQGCILCSRRHSFPSRSARSETRLTGFAGIAPWVYRGGPECAGLLAVWDALNWETRFIFRRLFQRVWRQIDLRKAVFDKLHSDVDVAGCLRIIEPGASTGHPIRPLSGCPIFDWQAGFSGFAQGIVGQLKC